MTVKELYDRIDGDYGAALKIMAAAETIDPDGLFEAEHTLKGVTANFGLTKISTLASRLTEEFRPGKERTMSDEEVREMLEAIRKLYTQTVDGIRAFTAG